MEIIKAIAYKEFCDCTENTIRKLKKLVQSYGLDTEDFKLDIIHLALFKTSVEYKLGKKSSEDEE